MNCGPEETVVADCRVGCQVVHINQPKNICLNNKYMGGVDQHDQMRMQYELGHFSKKAWTYILWFFVNASLVNAYILYKLKAARVTQKRYLHIDFCRDVAQSLIAGFTLHKRKADPPMHIGPVVPAYEDVHVGKKQRRCRWHSMQKIGRKETVYGCEACNVHICKDGCHYAYHQHLQNKILILFLILFF